MNIRAIFVVLSTTVAAIPLSARCDPIEQVKIGVLADMSGTYADLSGSGAVKAVEMAVADFGGEMFGKPIKVISANHQNKPDIGATRAREWFDVDKVTMITDLMNSGVAVAVSKVAAEKSRIAIINGAGTDTLTNEDCTPVTVHYAWDSYAMATGMARSVTKQGGNSWFFVTADYSFGKSLEINATRVVKGSGGKVLGSARHPLAAADFSSFMLRAQMSGAQVVALADGGQDAQNAVKSASEFGLLKSGNQRLVALSLFNTDIAAIGLQTTQGIYVTEAFYWDLSDEARAWSRRFLKETGKMPSAMQAGDYSATLHYLKAVKAAGTSDASAVMRKMRELPVNDFFAKNGRIREDGRMVHDIYLMQVKSPSQSRGKWDLYNVVSTIPGDAAFQPLNQSRCPRLKG